MFKELTDQIEEIMSGKCTILFVADACPKCNQLRNTISQVSESTVYVVNLMNNLELAKKLGIQNVPLLCKFEGNKMTGKLPFEIATLSNVKKFLN